MKKIIILTVLLLALTTQAYATKICVCFLYGCACTTEKQKIRGGVTSL